MCYDDAPNEELNKREDPSQRAMARKPANERSSERVRIGAPATLKWGEQELTGFVEVVNTNGMFVATPKAPEIGDYVELVFSLPGDRRSFRVRGNVVFLDQIAPAGARAPRLRGPLRTAARHPPRRDPEPPPGSLNRRSGLPGIRASRRSGGRLARMRARPPA